ncbi:UNVERIFIED_CONTAM: LINE-1 retrotransposable element O protein [Sesamum latifolium]|uniref:LINE-1 retrotransposable element O protein n=1 Tax=Sesamum latifolium TaxID=2727402 RepID=A0AAW2XSZ6_9LAMI
MDEWWRFSGDFNEILEHTEKEGGPMRAEWQIHHFRECLWDCELHDLGFQGTNFTWCNNQQEPHTVRERLDRACVSLPWIYSQTERQNPITGASKARELRAKEELSKLISQEKIFWKQRSKDLWLKEGDRNSNFFHAKASRRFQTNYIQKIKRAGGEWADSVKEVQRCILDYFQEMFTCGRPSSDDIQRGVEYLPTVVDVDMVEALQQPFSEEEVTKAIFHMSPLKSPGPDGLPPVFFHKFWHVIKHDVVTYVLNFLNHRILPSGFNDTNIVLIPKCKNPALLQQFLPISLCNVVYKIASKTIANRLKLWLDCIISPSQSTFVPGRLITDNVLLAFEINHFLNTRTKGRKHFMNLKLDISKAYDRVEWPFLQRVLGKLGFPASFIELIMLCVASVKYSFVLNSTRFGSITPQRGLRQGDPLSPYLFLLCTESLCSLFRNAEVNDEIPGVAVYCGAPKISHLLFVDDTMVFCPANPKTMNEVRRILEVYRKASGQETNFLKSSAAFSRNTPGDTKILLADLHGIRLENKHDVYLGLPAAGFRSKRTLFASLKDRIWKRIHGWHEKTLSLEGKATLIQSVVQAIPAYAMSCFRLSKILLKEFQSLAADFFWNDGDHRRIHWIAWDKMCTSKLKGGLEFRNLETFNLALLVKQLWHLITRPQCLVSKVLKARYFPRRHLLKRKWEPAHRLLGVASLQLGTFLNRAVDGISVWGIQWTFGKIRGFLASLHSVPSLLTHPIFRTFSKPDLLIWHYSNNGIFSVQSAYHLALSDMFPVGTNFERLDLKKLWKNIWQYKVPNKVKIFSWRAIRNILPIGGNIKKTLRLTEIGCPFCDSEEETGIHILQQCSFARQVWALSSFRWAILGAPFVSVEDWFLTLSIKMTSTEFELFLMFCWTLWWSRNLKSLNKDFLLPQQVVDFARSYLAAFETVCSSQRPRKPSPPLPPGTPSPLAIKINFDGSVLDGGATLGLGVVARDLKGRCLFWQSSRLLSQGPAILAEALAAREAIRFVVRQACRTVIIEGDCASLLDKISEDRPDHSVVGPIVFYIKALASQVQFIKFLFVHRSGNAVADKLARMAINLEGDFSNFPQN